jgi:hypothetical protein
VVEGLWPIFFLGVVLKIPIFAALYLIFWAVRAEPEADGATDDDDHGFRRWRTDPRRPRGPRRGPHQPGARPLPDCPPGGRLRDVRRPVPGTISADGVSERSR